MDLIAKMVAATEEAVADQTGYTKLEFSLDEADNARPDYTEGFSVRPTTLEQQEGGVGFIFFRQGFRISIYTKYYRGSARDKLFSLYGELAKILERLYRIRVSGDGYTVVNIDGVSANEPVFHDAYIQVDLDLAALVRMTKLFRG